MKLNSKKEQDDVRGRRGSNYASNYGSEEHSRSPHRDYQSRGRASNCSNSRDEI
jgi:hypothetical protein